jgi:flagellar motor switch protein FliM
MTDSQRTLLVRPDREAASSLPALEDLFRSAARDVRTRLVNRAGADVPVRLGVAQVTTVGEILDDTDARDGGVFSLFRFNPMGLPGLVIVQGRLLSRLVGVLLGEDPEAEPPPYRVRPVTRVEMRFCRRVVEDVLESLSNAWPAAERPRLEVESLGSNPRLAKGLSQSTGMVAASLDFGPPYSPYGLMIVAVPGQAARDLKVPKVDAISAKVRTSRYDAERILPVRLTAVAELARTQVSLGDLQGLSVGSTLDLGPRQQVQVRINGRQVMTGEPGAKGGSHSVRILSKQQG